MSRPASLHELSGCAQNGDEIAGVDLERDAVDSADDRANHLVVNSVVTGPTPLGFV